MSKETVELDYVLQYDTYIVENGLDKSKFPPAIGKKIRAIKMLVGKYKAQPSEARKQHIIREDILTADLIASWVEQDFPDKIVDPTPTKEDFDDYPVETPPAPEKPINTPSTPEKPVETTPVAETEDEKVVREEKERLEKEAAEKLSAMEKLVRDGMNGNRIKTDALKSIIGKTPNRPIQDVGRIKLKRVFMGDCYEEI